MTENSARQRRQNLHVGEIVPSPFLSVVPSLRINSEFHCRRWQFSWTNGSKGKRVVNGKGWMLFGPLYMIIRYVWRRPFLWQTSKIAVKNSLLCGGPLKEEGPLKTIVLDQGWSKKLSFHLTYSMRTGELRGREGCEDLTLNHGRFTPVCTCKKTLCDCPRSYCLLLTWLFSSWQIYGQPLTNKSWKKPTGNQEAQCFPRECQGHSSWSLSDQTSVAYPSGRPSMSLVGQRL